SPVCRRVRHQRPRDPAVWRALPEEFCEVSGGERRYAIRLAQQRAAGPSAQHGDAPPAGRRLRADGGGGGSGSAAGAPAPVAGGQALRQTTYPARETASLAVLPPMTQTQRHG